MGVNKLQHYIKGAWVDGQGEGKELVNAISGAPIAIATSKGIDFGAVLAYGRDQGKALRKMTFQERGQMLKALAFHLLKKKEDFYQVSAATGATRMDSWIDIEGGIGNLFANASLRKQFPDLPYFAEGDTAPLSRGGSFIGHHILVPKRGVALHINAFNFPVWGMLEKAAVNWLAGVPAVVKPATITSFLTEAVTREIIASGILPEGALQLICGSAGDMLDHLESEDVVTFTGSAYTGKKLKTHQRIIDEAVPFNMEADSLNCAALGPDAVPGTAEFDLFVKEVRKEMTTKCGQKCTAIRRILVPENQVEAVREALTAQLGKVVIGDPAVEGVRMGALAGREQLTEVRERIAELTEEASVVFGDPSKVDITGGSLEKGAFISPVLLQADNPLKSVRLHEVEAFGPVSTIMPYKSLDEAAELARMGKGSLVCSIATADKNVAREFTLEVASMHGRVLILNEACAKESTGHGSPMPLLVHGGPGRAGGGEEMGGKRGVTHYMQRTAIQGSPTMITEITQVYQPGGEVDATGPHPFRKHFEELKVGDSVTTHKRSITEYDIVQFANVSWDHFYAHTDTTSLDGTLFEERVAHGYFILAASAGLFVDPGKGPVLLNYGLEDCRFMKPVYAGATIGVKLTVKEKISQEKRDEEDVAKGIVKFFVEVTDQEDELVAVATILTMVKKLDQS